MHQLLEHQIMWLILLGFILCGILFCCYTRFITPFWRERHNKNRIIPTAKSMIMVNPMRIQQEKIMRII